MISMRLFKPRRWSLPVLLTTLIISTPSLASPSAAPWESPSAPAATSPAAQDTSAVPAATAAITLPLSPKALNIFNFGTHIFKVQYPPGTAFSGIDMTVTAVQISQAAFTKRVAGTAFANAVCVVYAGALGNCIDYQVTCTNSSHQAMQCPITSSGNISVWTSFDTTQSAINPGFLSTEIGANAWANKFDAYFLMKVDPTAHGHTNGWSEFVTVAQGATNAQGLGEFAFNAPLLPSEPRSFQPGTAIPVSFHLKSVLHCGEPVTDASAGLSVVQVADAQGRPVSVIWLAEPHVFKFVNGSYEYSLQAEKFPAGTYILTVYGNAFAATATYFTIQ